MSPTTLLQIPHPNSKQEQSDSRPPHLSQPQRTQQGYSNSLTTLPHVLGAGQRHMEETYSSSADHDVVENHEGFSPSTTTSLEASYIPTVHNYQGFHTPHEDCLWHRMPKASMFQSARGFNIHGKPRFINIGNVNQLGALGSQALGNFEKFVSFNALHDSSAQDFDRQVHQVVRQKTLEQLQDWIDRRTVTEQIIWLHGPAGIGKTAIALEIARIRQEVAATFFFYRPDPSRNDGNRLFTTLAWQLVVSIPDIKSHIIHSLNERPDLPKKCVEAQFDHLVVRPFSAMKEAVQPFGPVVIIDGIDECADKRLQRRVLSVIGSAIRDRRIPLRFIISSRPEAHIQETFDEFQCPVLCVDLAKFGPAEEIKRKEEAVTKREEELMGWEQELERREAGIHAEAREQSEQLMQDISRTIEEGERKATERMEAIERKEEELKKRDQETSLKEEESNVRELEIRRMEEDVRRRQEETEKKEDEIERREEIVLQIAEEMRQKTEQIRRREEELKNREEELERRRSDNRLQEGAKLCDEAKLLEEAETIKRMEAAIARLITKKEKRKKGREVVVR